VAEKTTVELLNDVAGFSDMSEYMQDEEFTKALTLVAKIIANPDIPPAKAQLLLLQLQSYSVKFGMLATWYANVKKDEKPKKNMYYSIRDAIDRLCDALKYMTRTYHG
jgi:hypothetical protein